MITLKTLPQATEQEVADHIITHLLDQGVKCKGTGVTCLYRNDEGLKCAAGSLISDKEYSEVFEGHIWTELVEEGLVSEEHVELIGAFQSIHDNCEPEGWKSELRRLVSSRGLKFPEGAIK